MTESAPIRNRIVGHGEESPEAILANPKNWRTHGKDQQEAIDDVLNQVGWVQSVIINRRTGLLVDGHLRVELAKRKKEPTIPVVYVDLSEEEEALILAALDPIGGLAGIDQDRLEEILQEAIGFAEGDGINNLLQNLANEIEDEKEEGEKEKPEVMFTEELMEEHNYVVLFFDNSVDWLQMKSILELPTVKALHAREGYMCAGTARVVKGTDALKKIMAWAKSNAANEAV